MPARAFQIDLADNVATLIDEAVAAEAVTIIGAVAADPLLALEAVGRGHKIALVELSAGEAIVKFGVRIGHATQPIQRGAWVHLHNLASDLDERSASLDPHTGAPTDTNSAYV